MVEAFPTLALSIAPVGTENPQKVKPLPTPDSVHRTLIDLYSGRLDFARAAIILNETTTPPYEEVKRFAEIAYQTQKDTGLPETFDTTNKNWEVGKQLWALTISEAVKPTNEASMVKSVLNLYREDLVKNPPTLGELLTIIYKQNSVDIERAAILARPPASARPENNQRVIYPFLEKQTSRK